MFGNNQQSSAGGGLAANMLISQLQLIRQGPIGASRATGLTLSIFLLLLIPLLASLSNADEGSLAASLVALSATPAPTRVSFQTVARGSRSGVREASQVVIRGQDQWQALWRKHTAIKTNPAPLPAIDFDKEIVAAVFLGEKPTGGYSIEITRVIRTDRSLVVFYRDHSPAPGAITTQAFTQPFYIVRIPDRDAGEVSFRRDSQ